LPSWKASGFQRQEKSGFRISASGPASSPWPSAWRGVGRGDALQFGTNWSRFSDATANIISPMLAYEGLTAFTLEAGFLGVLLFGRNLVPALGALRLRRAGGGRHLILGPSGSW
jgi:hypothetical protein